MGVVFGTRFVGRQRELGEVRDVVADNRVVTLTGIGGAGKTRLATQLLDQADAESAYADGVVLVALADLTDPSLLGHTVAAALGLQLPGSGWDPRVLTDHLRDRQLLLCLDNCEHLVEQVAPLVARLVRDCPRLSVLATSRMPLGIAGETVYEVPALDLPDDPNLSPEELAGFDAVALFVDRARAASASFRLAPANAAAVAELVGALDGIPLALELAAARVRVAAPEVLLSRLGHQPGLLEGRLVDTPERHRSMAASVGWSYQLCTPQEQALWCRLAVFAGGFDIEAAEAVCAGGTFQPAAVLSLLMSLADKSVISQDPEHPGRYRMLEPMRQYGAGQAEASGELTTWRDAHLAWFEALAATMWSQWSGPDQLAWLVRLRRELPNVRAALEHAVADPRTSPAALRICPDLEPYWFCDGAFNEARHWLDLALAQPTGTPGERARAAAIAGRVAAMQLDRTYAHARLAESAALIATLKPSTEDTVDTVDTGDTGNTHATGGGLDTPFVRVEDSFVRAYHRVAAGVLALNDGEMELAVEHELAAVAELERTAQTSDHTYLQAKQLAGMIRALQGAHAEATQRCSEVLALCEARGELYARTASHWILGLIAFGAGDLATAEQHELRGLQTGWQLDNKMATAMSMEALAWVEAALGRGAPAATLLGAAEAIWRVIHMPLPDSPHFAQPRAAAAAMATSAVGADEYDRAFAHGLTTGISSAVDLAENTVVTTARSEGPSSDRRAFDPLTRRETEIAALIAEGLSNRQIAERLVISERTVHGHVVNILTKLDATSRAKIASWYVRRSHEAANGV